MESLKRSRRPVRKEFTTLSGELDALLRERELKVDVIRAKFKILSDTYDTLLQHDQGIIEQMTADEFVADLEDREYEEIREYKMRFESLRILKEKLAPEQPPVYSESVTGGSQCGEARVRNFKLPTIQIKKFTGELTDWLAFWAQFQKIDEDAHMCGSDKFWYLLQSLEPGTDAHEIAVGYPQSNENYEKVIRALKKRFGNEDLLLQVYIRQLLNLVITNVQSKEKIPMKSLYLKIDSHLRALKTLNLEKADPATWLFPLVESSLPDRILDNWQRSPLSTHDGTKEVPPRTRLDILMSFLEREVEIKQKIDITRSFANEQSKAEQRKEPRDFRRPNVTGQRNDKVSVPTLSSFHNADKEKCVFCKLSNHTSKTCFRAGDIPYQERMNILKENQLCFRCCGDHFSKNCREKNLQCSRCKRSHLTILCRDAKRKHHGDESGAVPIRRVRVDNMEVPRTSSKANVECTSDVALQTLLVKIGDGENSTVVRAFIDSGCQRSYILRETAKKLKLTPSGFTRVIHSLFGDRQTEPVTHNLYELQLQSIDGNFNKTFVVRENTKLCGRLPIISKSNTKIREELRLSNIILSDEMAKGSEIELLIGGDIYAQIIMGEIFRLSTGAAAINTKLGWTLMGQVEGTNDESLSSLCISLSVTDVSVTKLWDLETLGIRDPLEDATVKREKELARESYVTRVSRDGEGRYVVELPWKANLPPLPQNREVAFKRLQSTSRKLINDQLFEAYDTVFKEWEKEGVIERAGPGKSGGWLHYLPHRHVVKESPTTPVRPVFDASCRVGKGPSLNDCLFKGENHIELIPEIIVRFREKPVAYWSDIRRAFLTIGIQPSDRDVLRFLWWSNQEMTSLVEYRHTRVVFGVTSSPFILAVVLFVHLTTLPDEDKLFGKQLLRSFFVDNCVGSEETVESYARFREKATEILKRAKMDLRLWSSNIDEADEENRVISVLGLNWDKQDDTLFVNLKNFDMPDIVTKRSVLASVQKIFDPIGFTAPCSLPMKMLLQRSWMSKLKWDQDLPEEESRLFQKWGEEVTELNNIRIPRLSTSGVTERSRWSFETFTDACKTGYSACVFLRVQVGDGAKVQLLAAKSRVAPVKQMTIPKLELMGCLLGVRLLNTVKRGLQAENVTERYWTDSTTALAWIRRNNLWGTFVQNRTKEINEYSKAEDWRFVPGVQNPADLPSRGCFPAELLRSRWWEGPKWLCGNEWPAERENYDEEEIAVEVRKTPPAVTAMTLIDSVRYQHTFAANVRIIGYVRRFLHNKLIRDADKKQRGCLTKRELETAEIIFIRELQREAFPIQERNKLKGLELFEDTWGVLRVRTRLTYREELAEFRFPVLLPNKRREVKQLIQDYHRIYCHAGVGFLMTKLRQKYWITKARQTVRGVIFKCERCSRFSAKPVIPEPAPLPLDRIKDADVFEVVGVDLAGPLILKSGKKVWLVIFTCAVYRAVHFEIVTKLSTKAFIRALENFVEKFRRPAVIHSDNGTNFRGADNLFKLIDWNELEMNERVPHIQWKFSPPTSSWWGGYWERLIRSAKDLLKRTVGKGSLQLEELKAIVKTICEVMNSRPLTYVSENPGDLEPLTPDLFLHPHGKAVLPERELTEAEKFRFRLNYVRTLKAELKQRFLKEYLGMLVNKNTKRATRSLKVGELVLIGSDGTKRIGWPLGKVVELIPGKDGTVRVARVKTENGELLRSVQRLYPLELSLEEEGTSILRENGIVTRSGRRVMQPPRFE